MGIVYDAEGFEYNMVTCDNFKARYRNKLKKIIIEVWNGEKWVYVKTLLDPLTEFRAECLAKVSSKQPVLEQKESQKFGQYLLNELPKKDTFAEKLFNELGLNEKPKKEVTEEEVKKLAEIAK